MVVHRGVFLRGPPLMVLVLLATVIVVGSQVVSLVSSMEAVPAAREFQRGGDSRVGRVSPLWVEWVRGLAMVWCLLRRAASSVFLRGRDVVVRTLRWLVRGSFLGQLQLVQPSPRVLPPAHGFHGCVLRQLLFQRVLVLVREGCSLAVREFVQ